MNWMKERWVNLVTIAVGLFGIGNGLIMLADPALWYGAVEGVPNTGPLNNHFVRDIGAIYLASGVLMLWALKNQPYFAGVILFALAWHGLHGAIHIWDVAAQRLPTEHLIIDLPGVFLPPVLLAFVFIELRKTIH